jgi:hypothetical protein
MMQSIADLKFSAAGVFFAVLPSFHCCAIQLFGCAQNLVAAANSLECVFVNNRHGLLTHSKELFRADVKVARRSSIVLRLLFILTAVGAALNSLFSRGELCSQLTRKPI